MEELLKILDETLNQRYTWGYIQFLNAFKTKLIIAKIKDEEINKFIINLERVLTIGKLNKPCYGKRALKDLCLNILLQPDKMTKEQQ